MHFNRHQTVDSSDNMISLWVVFWLYLEWELNVTFMILVLIFVCCIHFIGPFRQWNRRKERIEEHISMLRHWPRANRFVMSLKWLSDNQKMDISAIVKRRVSLYIGTLMYGTVAQFRGKWSFYSFILTPTSLHLFLPPFLCFPFSLHILLFI
jgi:hypothetical protein